MKDNASYVNAEKSTKFLNTLCEEYRKYNHIDSNLYINNDIKRGLRNQDGTGVLAGLTLVGDVVGYEMIDGKRTPISGKLFYRGYDIEEVVLGYMEEGHYGYEEISYLLLFGRLPSPEQLEIYNNMLSLMRFLPDFFTETLILKSPSPNIMNKIATATLALYSYDENPDDTTLENMMKQGIGLIARFPMIVAYAYQAKRHYYDRDSLYLHYPKDGQSTAESILRTLRNDKSFTKEEALLLDLCLVMHADHGAGNNSTFTSRVVASTGTDTYSSIAAAVGSLKGPLHGGANIKVVEMFDDIKANVKNWNDEGEIADYLLKLLKKEKGDRSGLIYGMGHAVYTISDPRAQLLKNQARSLAEKKGYGDEFRLIESVEKLSPELFKMIKGNDKSICANVDMYSGFVYKTLGIPMELYTPLFASARISGWVAHRIEEATTNARIIRPAYKSVSEYRKYVKMNDR